jgi:hypothetical protein
MQMEAIVVREMSLIHIAWACPALDFGRVFLISKSSVGKENFGKGRKVPV